jgi:pSer/pThr/pTyr-binding forkhead associated (FHA) protein
MTSSSSLNRTLILSVMLPDGSRQEVFVQRGLTIGRTDANTVCIDHPDVERIHARVSSQPDGTFFLQCQTDKSGLWVDGLGFVATVESVKTVKVAMADRIGIGTVQAAITGNCLIRVGECVPVIENRMPSVPYR